MSEKNTPSLVTSHIHVRHREIPPPPPYEGFFVEGLSTASLGPWLSSADHIIFSPKIESCRKLTSWIKPTPRFVFQTLLSFFKLFGCLFLFLFFSLFFSGSLFPRVQLSYSCLEEPKKTKALVSFYLVFLLYLRVSFVVTTCRRKWKFHILQVFSCYFVCSVVSIKVMTPQSTLVILAYFCRVFRCRRLWTLPLLAFPLVSNCRGDSLTNDDLVGDVYALRFLAFIVFSQ